jgi:hypothetical protein
MLCTHISCRSSKIPPKNYYNKGLFPLGYCDHNRAMITSHRIESHWHKALFLVVRTMASHCKPRVHWKYVINHVRNFGCLGQQIKWYPASMASCLSEYDPFTLGGVRAEKTRGHLWAFWACCLAPKLLRNAGPSAPRFANWLPKFDVILFPALGPIQGEKVQHLISNLGQIENTFFRVWIPWGWF